MAIAPTCDRCHEELQVPGGLLFSPPLGAGLVVKYHLCRFCFENVLSFVARGVHIGSSDDPSDSTPQGQ